MNDQLAMHTQIFCQQYSITNGMIALVEHSLPYITSCLFIRSMQAKAYPRRYKSD